MHFRKSLFAALLLGLWSGVSANPLIILSGPANIGGGGGGGGATTPPDNQWVTALYGASSPRNNYSGWVGAKITMSGTPRTLTRLGRWVISGNTGTHEVAIFDAAGTTKLASAMVDTTTASAGSFAWKEVSFTLAASTTYVIASSETNGGDQFYDATVFHTVGTEATLVESAFGASNPDGFTTGDGALYGPVNFGY